MPMTAVTNVPADAPLADEVADEDLVEMANLPEEVPESPGRSSYRHAWAGGGRA